jgi:hypothetical protein
MRIIVYDKSGTVTVSQKGGSPGSKRRRDYILELLQQKQVSSELWTEQALATTEPSKAVVLAHSSDLLDSIESQLNSLAEKGGLVVFYSGGQFTENEKQKGEGWVYWRRWDSLEEAVGSVEEGFEQLDFKKVLDNPPRRNLLAAVAILSWCASAQVSDRVVRQRQKQWRESREKWQQVFRDVSEEEFLQAASPGGDTAPNWPAGLSKVEQLVKWVKWVRPEAGGAGEPAAPDHAKVLEELQHTFRWKL